MPTPDMPLPPPAHSAPLPSLTDTKVLNGVPFAAIPGARPLELDLYLPAGDGPHPVVVFLHGGGWRLGSRHSGGPAFPGATLFEPVAAAGIAVASVDYRLSGEAVWPAQLTDAKAAVRWLRARADELGLDGDRIAAWGESAGGHLAALLGLTCADESLEGDVGITGPSSGVSAVVAWYPPTDLVRFADDSGGDPMDPDTRESRLLGAPPAVVAETAAQASPVSHVSDAAPPCLLLHGDSDRMVPHVQSDRLADALRSVGAAVTLHTYPGADHMWFGSPDVAADALDRTVAFLRHHLIPAADQP